MNRLIGSSLLLLGCIAWSGFVAAVEYFPLHFIHYHHAVCHRKGISQQWMEFLAALADGVICRTRTVSHLRRLSPLVDH